MWERPLDCSLGLLREKLAPCSLAGMPYAYRRNTLSCADVLVMVRPFRQTDRVVLDPPLLIVEILSPEDTTHDTLRRFREYEKLGVRYIVQMDPEDRTTHRFLNGSLVHGDLTSLETPNGLLPFDTRDLLARLDDESGDHC